jgi:hypothetical protein
MEIPLIPFDVFDHQILASELNVVGKMIDELIVA